MNLEELSAGNSAMQAYRRFESSKAGQDQDYDVENYNAVFAVTIFFQFARYIVLLLALKF